MRLIFFVLSALVSCQLFAQPSQSNISKVLSEINHLRSIGCQCGGQWMPPVGPVKWNDELYHVSNKYARYMAKNDHFDHISKTGEDLGDRLNDIGYDWSKIGENLGFGYHDFYSVLDAWKESSSHCKMLMDADMTDMGLSKHNIYWVQSFSRDRHPLAMSSYSPD